MLTIRLNHVVSCNLGRGVENLEFNVQIFYSGYVDSHTLSLCAIMARDDDTPLDLDDMFPPKCFGAIVKTITLG